MNKRIIRVIIYEGDEELVDAYEANSLQHTQYSRGHPNHWQTPKVEGKSIFITGRTLKEEIGLFQAIEQHNQEIKRRLFNSEGIELKVPTLDDPILNQLNK